MFGFPNETISQWNNDIEKAIKLNVEHISAYSLMYEEGTALYKMLDKGTIKECSDDTYLEMYNLLIDKLTWELEPPHILTTRNQDNGTSVI